MKTHRDPLAESLRAAVDAEALESTTGDDEALLARAVDRAMAASIASVAAPVLEAPTREPAPSPAPVAPSVARQRRATLGAARPTRARLLRYALPAAAALVATVAMAAIYINSRAPSPPVDLTHAPDEVTPSPVAPAQPPVVTPATEAGPTISVDDLPTVSPRGSGEGAPAEVAIATPADLFRDANASRRAGEVDHAVQLYSTLVKRYADTPEAHAARVSLGRLLLDRRDDAAGALAQFDAYLRSSSPDRALAEEARLGRALVFQRQGRQEEERRAWQELLDRHPDSLYASRARERLRALAPAAPGAAASSPLP